MFAIEVLPDHPLPSFQSPPAVCVQVTINGFQEIAEVPLVYWSIQDYYSQWQRACTRVVAECVPSSLLMHVIGPPRKASSSLAWVLYPVAPVVYVQQTLIIKQDLRRLQNWNDVHGLVRPRAVVAEDGERISEWRTDLASVSAFCSRLSAATE